MEWDIVHYWSEVVVLNSIIWQVTTWHQPISLDMKRRRLQVGLPCVWSGGGRRPPPSAPLSACSPSDCLPLSCRLSPSASRSFCLSFRSSSSSSSSPVTSLLCLFLPDFGGWAFPGLSSGSLSELERTTHTLVEGGCWGLGGSEPAEEKKRGEGGRELLAELHRVIRLWRVSFPRWDIHHRKSVTVWQNDSWHESKTQFVSL